MTYLEGLKARLPWKHSGATTKLSSNKVSFRSPLESLPTEVLLEIFSYLDYISLNINLRGTCQRFKAIMKDSSNSMLGVNLFRDKKNGEQYKAGMYEKDEHGFSLETSRYHFSVHPFIHKVKVRLQEGLLRGSDIQDIDSIGFINPEGVFTQASSIPKVLSENALAPGVQWIKIKGDEVGSSVPQRPLGFQYVSTEGHERNGLTVGDFLHRTLNRVSVVRSKYNEFELLAEYSKKDRNGQKYISFEKLIEIALLQMTCGQADGKTGLQISYIPIFDEDGTNDDSEFLSRNVSWNYLVDMTEVFEQYEGIELNLWEQIV